MIIRNIRRKLFLGASLLIGTGIGAYYFHSRFVHDPNREILKTLQENSTIIALSNNQIANYAGPLLTSSIPNENIPDLSENDERFSFNLDLRKGKFEDSQDEFAELLVNCTKLENIWAISSIDIRFKNSNSKWFKLFETFRVAEPDCSMPPEEIEKIANSNLHQDSEEILKTLVKNESLIFKVIDMMLKDKQKMSNLGPPLVFLSLLIQKNDPELKLGQLKVEGKKATAELMFYIEKSPDAAKLKAAALMYQLVDDFILSDSELAIKYQNDAIRSIANKQEWRDILSSVNLSKVIEDKIIKNHRSLSSIGKPIEFKCVIDEKKAMEDKLKVKLRATGRLNDAELMLTLDKDALLEKWKVSSCDFKILWRT
ncbi:hypothetical protein BpHYR1_008213 [Brachionus plicatilis]|uniref:Uncharacterized protein n=1 Tax=Brachionus plicatilis TaxID=10195 RepID=A0A3M7PGP9_BRAPC|nr:hypothetical protein BpHYR1_008213 [Brachionus plicatilis]